MFGDTFTVFDYLFGFVNMIGESAQGLLGLLGGVLGGVLGDLLSPTSNSSPYKW